MENNELKKVRIKNYTCYCFDDIIKLEDFYLDNILIDEKSHENILIYDISYKTLINPKPLRSRFDKIDGFIRIYDGTRYITFFGSEKYDAIYNRISIRLKCGVTDIFSHYFTNIKVDPYESFFSDFDTIVSKYILENILKKPCITNISKSNCFNSFYE